MPDTGDAPSPWVMVLSAVNQVNARLDKLVSIDVHHADLRRVDGRLNEFAADLGVERAARAESDRDAAARIDALTTAIQAESTSRREAVDNERAARHEQLADTQRRILRGLYALAVLFVSAAGVIAAFLAIHF